MGFFRLIRFAALGYVVVWLLTAGLMLGGLPILIALALGCVLTGVVLTVVSTIRVLAGVRRVRPRTITPDDVLAGTAKLPKQRADQRLGRDPAWPHYLIAQWRVDLGAAWAAPLDLLRSGFQRIGLFTGDPTHPVLRAICGALAILFWLLVSGGAVLTAAVVQVLCFAVRTVAWLGWLAAVGVLRGGDFLVRRVRGATASCQHCYLVCAVPVFSCDRCGRLHRDLRPGRLGALWRRCACGRPVAHHGAARVRTRP